MTAPRLRLDASQPLPGQVVTSVGTYDLTDSSYLFGVSRAPEGLGVARLRIYPDGGNPNSNALTLGFEAGQLVAGLLVNGADPGRVTAPWTGARYLRVRSASGQVALERSPDGVAWTVARTVTVPWGVTAVRAQYQAGGGIGWAEFDTVGSPAPMLVRGTSAATSASPANAGFASGVATGRLVLTALVVNKAAGAISSSWTGLAPFHSGVNVGGGLAAKVTTGTTETASWSWTTVNGAQAVAVETNIAASGLGGLLSRTVNNGDVPTTPVLTAQVVDGAGTALTAPSAGLLVAATVIDNGPLSGSPWQGSWVVLRTAHNIVGSDVAGGAAVSIAARTVKAGEPLRATVDWGQLDAAWLSVAFVPLSTDPVVRPPSAPVGQAAGAGDAQATVSWQPPADNGGAAITGYRVTVSPGGQVLTSTGSPLTVTNLTNGTAYTFAIAAQNSAGYGTEAITTPVTPGTTAVVPTIGRRMVGVDDQFTCKTTGATSVRLKIGTDAAVSAGVRYSVGAVPNAKGNVRVDFSGLKLTPGTYFYRVAATDTSGTEHLDTLAAVGTFDVWPSGAHSYTVIPISCDKDPDRRTWNSLNRRQNKHIVHTGDQLYHDDSGETEANFDLRYNNKYGKVEVERVTARSRYAVGPSDHCFMYNNHFGLNGTRGANANALYNAIHREILPTRPTPAAVTNGIGVGYDYKRGRVRHLHPDQRSFKSNRADPDTSSKTMLGAAQKAWVKDVIANTPEPMLFYYSDVVWIQAVTTGSDGWGSFDTERQELIAAFKNSGKHVIVISGDTHYLAYSPGTTASGNIPNFLSSPVGNISSPPNSLWTAQYPTVAEQLVYQYATVDVEDTGGGSITITYRGWSAGSTDTERLTYSQTYTVGTAPPATPPGAPTEAAATAGTNSATVSFTPPASDGGAPITGYRVTSTPGAITATGSASPIKVGGLAGGTSYTFTVAATNSVGYGAESAASNAVTPTSTLWSPLTQSPRNTGPAAVSADGQWLELFSGNSQWARLDFASTGTDMADEVAFLVEWVGLDTTTSRWVGFNLGASMTDDVFHNGSSGSTSPSNGLQGIGYRFGVRQNGGMLLGRFDTSGGTEIGRVDVLANVSFEVTKGLRETVRLGRRPVGHERAGHVYLTRVRSDGSSLTAETTAPETKWNGPVIGVGKFGHEGIDLRLGLPTITT